MILLRNKIISQSKLVIQMLFFVDFKGDEVPNFDENSTHIRPITIPKMPVNYDS